MSKNNYYSIHKNKNTRNKAKKVDFTSVNEVIIQANKLVKSIIELNKSIYDFSEVKGYSELKQQLAIVVSNDKPEIIVDKMGNQVVIKEDHNLDYIRINSIILSNAIKQSFPSLIDIKKASK